MTCRQLIEEQLGGYVDGTLGEEEGRQVDSHLGECGSCRSYLQTYRKTIELAGLAGDVEKEVVGPRELQRE